jgi:hypothetical protein
MLKRKTSIAAVIGTFAMLSASVATAGSHEFNPNEFNKKELNGRSSYIGVAYISSQMADIGFQEAERTVNSSKRRNGMTAGFADPDGIMGTIGNDYGYVRIETEFAYRESDVNKLTGTVARTAVSGPIDIGTAFVNLAFEYSIDPGEFKEVGGSGKSSGFSITPYITAGGGALGVLGNLNFTNTGSAPGNVGDGVDHEMFLAPAIQGGAGITIGLPMGVEVFGQYSEMLAYTYNYRDSNDIHIKSITGGLRFNF